MGIAAIKQIISDVLTERFPARQQDTVLELHGSRVVAKRSNDGVESQAWKHSFHLIYPDLVFRCNNGLMKQIASQVHWKVGSVFGLPSDHVQSNPVDLAVYGKDQLYRAPLCHKSTDPTRTRLSADVDRAALSVFSGLPYERQMELQQFYAQAFVTNVEDLSAIIDEVFRVCSLQIFAQLRT